MVLGIFLSARDNLIHGTPAGDVVGFVVLIILVSLHEGEQIRIRDVDAAVGTRRAQCPSGSPGSTPQGPRFADREGRTQVILGLHSPPCAVEFGDQLGHGGFADRGRRSRIVCSLTPHHGKPRDSCEVSRSALGLAASDSRFVLLASHQTSPAPGVAMCCGGSCAWFAADTLCSATILRFGSIRPARQRPCSSCPQTEQHEGRTQESSSHAKLPPAIKDRVGRLILR